MKYIVTLNGKKYEVEVEKGQATAVYAGEADWYFSDCRTDWRV